MLYSNQIGLRFYSNVLLGHNDILYYFINWIDDKNNRFTLEFSSVD